MREITPKTDSMMDMPMETVSSGKKERKKIYPRLRLEHEFFPETKKWDVEKEYIVKLKLRMTGLSISRFQNDSEFDITGFEEVGKKNNDK